MSIQEALEKHGVSYDEFNAILKIRKIVEKDGEAEVRLSKEGLLSVYEVKKKKV